MNDSNRETAGGTPPEYRRDLLLLPSDADTKIATSVKFGGSGPMPVFMPGGAFVDPGVLDPFESHGGDGEWYPNSHRTRLLCAAVHAAKDVATCTRALDPNSLWQERRAVAHLATPLVSMCDRTKELCDALGRESAARSHWPEADLSLLRDVSRRLKRHCNGALRTLRNTLTAHIDLERLRHGAGKVESLSDLIMPPFGDALLLLLLSLNYPRVYTWKRSPPGAHAGEAEFMTEYPLAIRATLNADGAIAAFSPSSTLALDPRAPLRDAVLDLFPIYNALARNAVPQQPTIYWRERDVVG